jgi:hypothetical protein
MLPDRGVRNRYILHAFVIFVVLSFTEYEGRYAGPVIFSRFPSQVERSIQ